METKTYTLAQLVVQRQFDMAVYETFLEATENVCRDILSRFRDIEDARAYANSMQDDDVLFSMMGYAFDDNTLWDMIRTMEKIRC